MSIVNKRGVDISGANGNVDFDMLKRNGIAFVMINLGNNFADNVKKAESVGMPWGAYYYTYSLSPQEDVEELNKILSRLSGKKPTLPIAIDVEDGDGYKARNGGWNRENVSRNARYLLGGLKKAGFYPMIYTGFEEIENLLDRDIYTGVDMWWAQWATRCGYPENNLGMWQFGGETNYICSPYIEGEIYDQNYAYKDYPTIIKQGGYNGWTPENVLDTVGYKYLDKDTGVLALKEMLLLARKLGITNQGMQENTTFGDGTLIAVNQVLKKGGYAENGIAGEKFIKYLAKLIREKL
jgi:hypothetical protein